MSIYCTSEHMDFLKKFGHYPDAYYLLNNLQIPQHEKRLQKLQEIKQKNNEYL